MARSKKGPIQQDDSGLVLMAKDGDLIAVHPSCVKAHEAAGWEVVQ